MIGCHNCLVGSCFCVWQSLCCNSFSACLALSFPSKPISPSVQRYRGENLSFEWQQEFKQQQQLVVDKIVAFEGRNLLSDEANKENLESHKPSSSLIKILETELECLPDYIKGLATWEEEIKEMEREQIREGIDEFGILYSELSDSNRSEGSNGSFAFLVDMKAMKIVLRCFVLL
ncbi:uncharacterized protein LOC107459355 isoform X3 [Arachis duranensis]|uniref:Uncharacterized protein LOC107459355 isoform X3 n=1 Tax=Arachis duranensis TaxID=130453 RepID=A0A9C6WKJ6_ARADU|nr:uncharacterized protein LOC107459355 isoform X3 [Arachis duranensis]